jgi:hypothetical protein
MVKQKGQTALGDALSKRNSKKDLPVWHILTTGRGTRKGLEWQLETLTGNLSKSKTCTAHQRAGGTPVKGVVAHLGIECCRRCTTSTSCLTFDHILVVYFCA